MGLAIADYDNEGHPDIFVAGLHHSTLYHDKGNGTFTDVTAKAGLDANLNRPDPLPDGVDPCGENGEFHSFVYAGPMLSVDIPVSVGEHVVRDRFVFADLKPATVDATPLSQ